MDPVKTLAAIPWPKDTPIFTKPGPSKNASGVTLGVGNPWWEAMARQLKCAPVNGWHSNAAKRCNFAAENDLDVNLSLDLFKNEKVEHPADETDRLEDEYCRTRLQMREFPFVASQVCCVTLRCEAMPKGEMAHRDAMARDAWFARIRDTALTCFPAASIRWMPAGPEHDEKWIPASLCYTSCMTAYRIADTGDLVDLGRCIQDAKAHSVAGVTLHLDVWHDRKGDTHCKHPYSPVVANLVGRDLAPHWSHISDVQLWDVCLGHPDGPEAGAKCLSAFFTGLDAGLKEGG